VNEPPGEVKDLSFLKQKSFTAGLPSGHVMTYPPPVSDIFFIVTVHRSSFIVHRSSFTVHRSSFVVLEIKQRRRAQHQP